MSTELAAPTSQSGEMANPNDLPDVYKDLLSNKEYLCRIHQNAATNKRVLASELVGGAFNYVIKEDETIDIGREFDCFVVSDRAQTLDFGGDVPITNTDPNSDAFKDVRQRADKDPKGSKCLYGPCFLLWIPKIDKFATLFLTSWTAKKQTKAIYALRSRWMTVKAKLESNSAHTWWSFVAMPCSLEGKPPAPVALEKWLNDFKNPQQGPEKDTSATKEDR